MSAVLTHLKNYSTSIINDKIPSCKKHKWAALRFLNDLEKQGFWRWVFDETRAEQYYNWMRCFKHRKGEYAGRRKEPVDYELFVYGNLYGWIDETDESRRFRRSYEQIPRKQAKSQDKGIQALYEISYFGEPSAEAYVAATKKDQTRFVWGEAVWLYQNALYPEIRDLFTCKYDEELLQKVIKCNATDSVFTRLSKDDGKKGYGSNPHFMILDEYHLHETTEYYDMGTSGQKTRKNPLLSVITTAGTDLNKPCYRITYKYISKILDPNNPVENDRFFAVVCEPDRNDTGDKLKTPDGRIIAPNDIIDDINSENMLMKTNIVTGYTQNVREAIKTELEEAKDVPEKMRDVKTMTFNIWIDERASGYINLGKWADCKQDFPDTTGMLTIPGLDLAATTDLVSVGFETPLPGGRYAVESHSFLPEEKYLRNINNKDDRVPYDLWKDQGWVTVTEGAQVDYEAVLEYLVERFEVMKWVRREACFDRMLATWLEQQVRNKKFTPLDIPQSYSGLSLATKDFRAKVIDKKVIHDGNPVLSWGIGNAVVRTGPSENIMLDKSKSTDRIDPIAALINAHCRAMIENIKPKQQNRVVFI